MNSLKMEMASFLGKFGDVFICDIAQTILFRNPGSAKTFPKALPTLGNIALIALDPSATQHLEI